MARAKPNEADLKQREETAQNWKLFRQNNFLTQRRLASILGISRRTVQQIEGAYITPHPDTLHGFIVLRKKYDRNADFNLQT